MTSSNDLDIFEYERYGRQMLVPELGKSGQLRLKNSRVLVIGAGGLGCPALLYLAGAGVGVLGIVDHDIVSLSNLPRQTLYSFDDVGTYKVDAAVKALKLRNPHVMYIRYQQQITPENAFSIISDYDIILDCTDSPITRYLIGDVTRIFDKYLVSASALRTDAQIVVLNTSRDSPCYRCIFPTPPSVIQACSDAGILGPVVGIAGTMQAMEAIKLINGKLPAEYTLTLYSPFGSKPWRVVRVRGRQSSCGVCGDNPWISRRGIENLTFDYNEFCGDGEVFPSLAAEWSISVLELKEKISGPHILLDVREITQFEIINLPGSINIPLSELIWGNSMIDTLILKDLPIYVICRYGNDSKSAVEWLRKSRGFDSAFNVKGGLDQWTQDVDRNFPRY
ncbi:hypothetical protein V1514DRAFT_338297 [Lipomyces japonicus]|uniref:uncharacterized protein n=1 Tax=Lipomyces japonicus TaxID=56871 RepID=UPI0034CE7C3D